MTRRRIIVPETNAVDPSKRYASPIALEKAVSHFPVDCQKVENHAHYKLLKTLTVQDLPGAWQHDWALDDLKRIGRRVVHLTLLEKSPQRIQMETARYGESSNSLVEGAGFLTFDPKVGPLVHTSKHVILNPWEAQRTIVRLFYDDDSATNELYKAMRRLIELNKTVLRQEGPQPQQEGQAPVNLPSSEMYWESPESGLYLYLTQIERHFRSVMCSDYTCFAVDWRVMKHFTKEEIATSKGAFSWRMASLRRILLAPQLDIDVGLVSHPHGMPKRVSFGKRERLSDVQIALHNAPSCGGSSGSPIICLNSDSSRYVTAGQFVHHGHWVYKVNKGIGTVRPPVSLPYFYSLDSEEGLANAVSLCYEPIFYWTLFACDLLNVETTLDNIKDVFAYTSTLALLFLGANSTLFQALWCCYWLHLLLSTIKRVAVTKWPVMKAVCYTVGTLISMSMFLVAWVLLLLGPAPFNHYLVVSLIWLLVLFVERYKGYSNKFQKWAIGDSSEFLAFRLAQEQSRAAREEKKDIETVHVQHRDFNL